ASSARSKAIGPYGVAAATELLCEGGLRYVIKEDVLRHHLRQNATASSVTTSWPTSSDNGPTELDNLVRLCREHHALKTHQDWRGRMEGGPGGERRAAPPYPVTTFSSRSRLAAMESRIELCPLIHDPPSLNRAWRTSSVTVPQSKTSVTTAASSPSGARM